jgi:hypothetical protein
VGIYKFSASSGFGNKTRYGSMLAGNPTHIPWAPSGAFDSIATASGDGSASAITFSNIPSTYTSLQIRVNARGVRAYGAEQFYIRVNGDTGNNYSYHYLLGATGGGGSGYNAGGNVILVNEFPAGNEQANLYTSMIVDVLDYRNTNKNKTFKSFSGHYNNGSGAADTRVWSSEGMWANTAAITSITLLSNGAFTSASKFALYGIKGI